jgi:hypothetical protein
MPIHRERYRRREGGLDLAGRAWMVIAANGLRTLVRKRAFLFLMILAWMPVVGRAVQIWAAANVPGMAEMGMLAVTPRMFRDFLNQQDAMTFFITVYVGSGLIADDIRAKAQIMSAVELGCILGEGVAALFAKDRSPVVLIPQIGIGRKVELRSSALTNIRAIGARDSENVETNVLTVIGGNRLVAPMSY